MKGKRSIRIAMVLVTSFLLVSVVASGVMASQPKASGDSGSNSSGPVEISLDVGSEEPVSKNPFDDRFPSVRQRPVEPHPRFKSPEDIVEGSTLELNLFENASYTANVHTQKTDINDVTRIRGDIEGYDHAFVVLSIRDGKISGTIEIPEERERFVVKNDPYSRSHYVSEVDLENLEDPQCSAEKAPESEEVEENRTSADTGSTNDHFQSQDSTYIEDGTDDSDTNEMDDIQPMASSDTRIDVMVVYTDAAENEVNDIDQVISNSVGTGNTVFDNSEIDAELNLVRTFNVDDDETNDMVPDLNNLEQDGSGKWDDVHDWRDDYGADLVALLGDYGSSGDVDGRTGRANVLDDVNGGNGEPWQAFSITNIHQAGSGSPYTFIHEIGHNLGCQHNPSDAGTDPLYDFSYGHKFGFTPMGYGEYCSVMSYTGFHDVRVPYFSNPDVEYEDLNTGSSWPTGIENDRDNARTIQGDSTTTGSKDIVKDYKYATRDLSISVSGGGTTQPSPGTYTYPYGEVVWVYAYADPGWKFSHWNDWTEYPSSSRKVTMDEDKSITAYFVPEDFDSYDMTYQGDLEKTAYEENLEEGTIPLELSEKLREEGVKDVDRESRLLKTEEGWWITVEGKKEYWTYETEEKLEIYAVEEVTEK